MIFWNFRLLLLLFLKWTLERIALECLRMKAVGYLKSYFNDVAQFLRFERYRALGWDFEGYLEWEASTQPSSLHSTIKIDWKISWISSFFFPSSSSAINILLSYYLNMQILIYLLPLVVVVWRSLFQATTPSHELIVIDARRLQW